MHGTVRRTVPHLCVYYKCVLAWRDGGNKARLPLYEPTMDLWMDVYGDDFG